MLFKIEFFKPIDLLAACIAVFIILTIYSLVGAITLPIVLNTSNGANAFLNNMLVLLISAIILALFGRTIGAGARLLKPHIIEACLLTYIGIFVLGSLLALMTLFNVPFIVHLNLNWINSGTYTPWLMMFLIGAPVMLTCFV